MEIFLYVVVIFCKKENQLRSLRVLSKIIGGQFVLTQKVQNLQSQKVQNMWRKILEVGILKSRCGVVIRFVSYKRVLIIFFIVFHILLINSLKSIHNFL